MKKTIFDLSYKEGKKIDKELRKTSYYKQYLNEYLIIVCILGFVWGFTVGNLGANESIDSSLYEMFFSISLIIIIGFLAIISIIFAIKRFNLVKDYYNEKYANKNGDNISE